MLFGCCYGKDMDVVFVDEFECFGVGGVGVDGDDVGYYYVVYLWCDVVEVNREGLVKFL